LPGHEDGNVVFVVRERAGVWAPMPERVARTLAEWANHPEERARRAEACRRAARPESARTIARILGARLGLVEERTDLKV